MALDKNGTFSTIYDKGDNFRDFLFVFPHPTSSLKMGLL